MSAEKKEGGLSKAAGRILMLVLFLLMALSFMDRQMIPALLEPMKQDLGFSDGQMGMIQSIFMVCIALCAAPVSLIVDRWSRRKSTACMAVLWSLMSICTGVFSSFMLLVGARGMAGAAQSAYKPAAIAWISTMLPAENRSKSVGILNMALPLGAALGTIGAGVIAQMTGNWRMAFYFLPMPGILLGVICLFLPDYRNTCEDSGGHSALKDWGLLLKNKTFMFASFASAAFTFGGFAILGWTPALYTRTYGLSEASAGSLVGLFLIVSALGSLMGGFLSDWWQRRNPKGRALASVAAALCMVAVRGTYLAALFCQAPLPLAIALGTLDSIIGYSWVPTNDVLLQDPVPPRLRASAFGFAYLIIYLFGASWGPTVVGFISDSLGGGTTGVLYGFIATLPIVALCPIFQLFILKTYIHDTQAICEDVEIV